MNQLPCIVLLIAIVSNCSIGLPIQDEVNFLEDTYLQPYGADENSYLEIIRRPRSPGGEIDFKATHIQRQGGYATGEYNHRLWQDGKAHLDANAYYRRNWGNTPGPRQDYGGGLKLSVPLGRH